MFDTDSPRQAYFRTSATVLFAAIRFEAREAKDAGLSVIGPLTHPRRCRYSVTEPIEGPKRHGFISNP
jgi:hypothetical protein